MNAPVPSLPTPPVAEAVPEPLNPFFRITIFAGGLFVITILAMIASALGPTSSSSIKAAFDENSGWLLAADGCWLAGGVQKVKETGLCFSGGCPGPRIPTALLISLGFD